MQIIFKAKEEQLDEAAEIVAQSVSELLPAGAMAGVTIRRVFPGLAGGQRARLFSLNLPDDLPEQKVAEVVDALSQEEALEYATIPAPKKALA